jgi:NAD(P)H-hydrate epimerase
MRRVEERAEELGVPRLLMMESAGKAVADFISARAGAEGKKVVVVAGTGNNGGDGFVAARHMAAYGASVTVFLVGSDRDVRTREASLNLEILKGMGKSIQLTRTSDASFVEKLREALSSADVIVDAIFGTGIRGELLDPHASVIKSINSSRAFKVSVDIPSGLDPLTGETRGPAVRADATVTFHRVKTGLLARGDLVGELVVANIGIPPEADTDEP